MFGDSVCSFTFSAQGGNKPNILLIMGDDIGCVQMGVYRRGIGLGATPNIDCIAEGAMFTSYYAMQSSTSGHNVFFTVMCPLRTGMIPPQLSRSSSRQLYYL
jgi:arylsulfatase A-like enzyme